MTWDPIETAPVDGTEILVRDADGDLSLVAWSDNPFAEAWCLNRLENEAGWYRRAEGYWDLFDSFAPQMIEAVRWMPIPDDAP